MSQVIGNWDVIHSALYPQSMTKDIEDFHGKFGLQYKGPPRQLDVDLGLFRTKFMGEELFEYAGTPDDLRYVAEQAMVNHIPDSGPPALVDQLDALVDLVYVALGTAYLHGFNFDEAWRRVHRANMAKVRASSDGSDSKRKSSHDVVKPPGWTAPDLSDLVKS